MKKSKSDLAMLLFLCVVGGIIAFVIIDIIQFKASLNNLPVTGTALELGLHQLQRKLVTLLASICVAGFSIIAWSEVSVGLQK